MPGSPTASIPAALKVPREALFWRVQGLAFLRDRPHVTEIGPILPPPLPALYLFLTTDAPSPSTRPRPGPPPSKPGPLGGIGPLPRPWNIPRTLECAGGPFSARAGPPGGPLMTDRLCPLDANPQRPAARGRARWPALQNEVEHPPAPLFGGLVAFERALPAPQTGPQPGPPVDSKDVDSFGAQSAPDPGSKDRGGAAFLRRQTAPRPRPLPHLRDRADPGAPVRSQPPSPCASGLRGPRGKTPTPAPIRITAAARRRPYMYRGRGGEHVPACLHGLRRARPVDPPLRHDANFRPQGTAPTSSRRATASPARGRLYAAERAEATRARLETEVPLRPNSVIPVRDRTA